MIRQKNAHCRFNCLIIVLFSAADQSMEFSEEEDLDGSSLFQHCLFWICLIFIPSGNQSAAADDEMPSGISSSHPQANHRSLATTPQASSGSVIPTSKGNCSVTPTSKGNCSVTPTPKGNHSVTSSPTTSCSTIQSMQSLTLVFCS